MVDDRELANFLKSRGVEPKCPICGEDQWGFVGNEEGSESRIVGMSRTGSLERGIPVSLLVCRHCGFVSAHAHSVITGETE